MPLGLVLFSQAVAFTFYGDDVQQLGAWYILKVFKGINQLSYVMPVNRPKVAELQRFKQVAAFTNQALYTGFHFTGHAAAKFFACRQLAEYIPNLVPYFIIGMAGGNICQVFF